MTSVRQQGITPVGSETKITQRKGSGGRLKEEGDAPVCSKPVREFLSFRRIEEGSVESAAPGTGKERGGITREGGSTELTWLGAPQVF